MQNNNPLAEIFLGATGVALVVGAIILLYFSKIDGTFATLMFGASAALFGVNVAAKAPSPTQQTQLGNLQQSLQDLISLFASHTHPVPPTPPPSTPTQPVQPVGQVPLSELKLQPGQTVQAPQFVPDPNTSMAAYQTGMMPTVKP